MATAVVTTPSVTSRNLPSPFPVSRVVAAVVLLSGATLQLIEELIEPPFASDTERFAWMAQHATPHAIDVGIGLAVIPLLIASVLLLVRLARQLVVSDKTVRNHVSSVFSKLNVADRAQAIVRARESGLGTSHEGCTFRGGQPRHRPVPAK